MLLLEAAGKVMFDDLAADADDDVRQWLLESGEDECDWLLTPLTHAWHSVPDSKENP